MANTAVYLYLMTGGGGHLIAGFADESDVELGEESKVTLTRIVLQLIMCISGHISHTAISITVKVVSSFWLH